MIDHWDFRLSVGRSESKSYPRIHCCRNESSGDIEQHRSVTRSYDEYGSMLEGEVETTAAWRCYMHDLTSGQGSE